MREAGGRASRVWRAYKDQVIYDLVDRGSRLGGRLRFRVHNESSPDGCAYARWGEKADSDDDADGGKVGGR